jgi:hypothetical protein
MHLRRSDMTPHTVFFFIIPSLDKLHHDVVDAEIPVRPVGRLRVDLNHVDVLAPRREVLRDVERERGLVAFAQVGRREGVVGADLLVDDAVGVDEDGRVLRRVVHGFAVEADEVEEGREVVGGGFRGRGGQGDARPERGVGVARGDECVGGGRGAVGVFGRDEAAGGGAGGVEQREAREGQMRVVR